MAIQDNRLTGLLRRNTAAVWTILDGQAVILNTAHQMTHTLNSVATCIWTAIDGVTDVETIAQTLVATYEIDIVTARQDVDAYLQTLATYGLLTFTEEL